MQMPIMLEAGPALSEFRLAALQRNVSAAIPGTAVGPIEARRVYFIELSGSPDRPFEGPDAEKASALLATAERFELRGGFLVTPRKGTISPWSSKASDIFRNCGIRSVKRVERGIHYRLMSPAGEVLPLERLRPALDLLHDRMTEGVYLDVSDIFARPEPPPYVEVDVLGRGLEALEEANVGMGLALSRGEMEYLCEAYGRIRRNPTDVELVMFGQVNSEHCRHKIFNASWVVDGKPRERSLFEMIRNTHERHPAGTLVAYRDNSGVIEGFEDACFEPDWYGRRAYRFSRGPMDIVMKVETHNHPTAISPYPGAATGVGGEIRDEGATGTGARSKAGLSGFMVSNLRVPGFAMPWEREYAPFPTRLAAPFEIMIEGPIGGARFGNEFGRPQLFGLFRTYEEMAGGRYRGYHKPIMVAGGMGNIKRIHAHKKDLSSAACIIQIGGPAMRIGLGGGAASSMATGSNAEDLDFDSVQRDNAEMQRRCQEVINTCTAMGGENPILSIHDIGAGGLSNGCPELVSKTGGRFRLRAVHNEDLSMSPMEIWCCEAQERYVLAIRPEALERFLDLCRRERCEVAVIGEATGDGRLTLEDEHFGNRPIDMDLAVILGDPPRMLREVSHRRDRLPALDLAGIDPREAAYRVLRFPAVANKTFLITIADRTVTGLTARDQMTGPWQTPVSDVAVTATSYLSYTGEAMSMGERTPLALISAPASGRMAVCEALTNIAAADVGDIGNVKLSGNWMCACGEEGEDAALYDTVEAVGMELCPRLGVSIPVGKDSLSMRTIWEANQERHKMTAPLSLVASAFGPVRDVRKTVTPDLKREDSELILIDLGGGRNRLGGSCLAQVFNQVGNEGPDADDPALFRRFFAAVQELVDRELLLAYHDRSDGGLFATLAEMAIAGRSGLDVNLDGQGSDPLAILFSEELGAVLQVADSRAARVMEILQRHELAGLSHRLGRPAADGVCTIRFGGSAFLREEVVALDRAWSELTFRMQSARDNPDCAKEEYDNRLDRGDPGLGCRLTFDPETAFRPRPPERPLVCILREQGVNGHVEMAAAFDRAGFESVDVHMTDLIEGRVNLGDFRGLVACGGFSYGDVLGAGSGWAKSILFNDRLKERFARFFERPDTFALGVCNGCQMISQLKEMIPGADDWPEFTANRSGQFEARFVTVEILPSPSIFFRGMEGSRMGIPVAHGEGRADFSRTGSEDAVRAGGLLCVRYVDNRGAPTERYPFNPNGSPGGMTGVTTPDGRVTILMPHPERAFRSVQLSCRPEGTFTGEAGPWLRMFRNAREFAG